MLKSIRWTLQVWHAGVLAAVLCIFGTATFLEISRSRYTQVNAGLERSAQLIAASVRPTRPPGPWGTGLLYRNLNAAVGARLPAELFLPPGLAGKFDESDEEYFAVWDREGRPLAHSRFAPDLPAPPPMDRPTLVTLPPPARSPDVPAVTQSGVYRVARLAGPMGVRVLVARSTEPEARELRHVALTMAATGAAVLLIGIVGGLALARRAVRPIADITAIARSISVANLSRRIPEAGVKSELGELAGVLNEAFGRLESAFHQQVRFTADASHELRTPLAVIHGQTQLALSRERSADEYRRSLETCQRASGRMKDLVDSLMLLAGADAGRLTLNRTRFDLAAVVRACSEMLIPIAAGRGVTIETRLAPAEIDADATRIGQVVTNVLSNAIRYNRDNGRVTVTSSIRRSHAVLAVADTGIGIPAEHHARVFDRFYRVDTARARADGGSGLGLAIGQSIVTAHGGTIEVANGTEAGAVFTIRLPLVRA